MEITVVLTVPNKNHTIAIDLSFDEDDKSSAIAAINQCLSGELSELELTTFSIRLNGADRLAEEIFNSRHDAVDGTLDLTQVGKKKRERPTVLTTRGGSSGETVYTPDDLPQCLYRRRDATDEGWDTRIVNAVSALREHGQYEIVFLDLQDVDASSGGAQVYVVQWSNGEGFTLLAEAAHEGHKFLAEGYEEAITLKFTLGKQPLMLFEGKYSDAHDLETPGRLQLAVAMTKAGLEARYEGLSNQHRIAVKPYFNLSEVRVGANGREGVIAGRKSSGAQPHWQAIAGDSRPRRYFDKHTTVPCKTVLPHLFVDVDKGELARMEWDEIPINARTPVRTDVDKGSDGKELLARNADVTTAMETEAEYVISEGRESEEALSAILAALDRIDAAAIEAGSDNWPGPDTPEKGNLDRLLGTDLIDSYPGRWKIERVRKYEVLDHNGSPAAKAAQELWDNKSVYDGLNASHFDKTDNGKRSLNTAGLDFISRTDRKVLVPPRKGLPRTIGRQGLLVDTYLYVDANGMVRERKNFRGRIAAVKGACKQADDSACLIRYNRQVPLNASKSIVQTSNRKLVAHENAMNILFGHPDIDFGDALRASPKGVKPAPKLVPCLQIESERYRYSIVHEPANAARRFIAELSFDISKGYEIRNGELQTDPVVTYGFELGLDHLGASGAGDEEAEKRPDSPDRESGSDEASHGKITLSAPEIERRTHDRADLESTSLFERHAYRQFAALARRIEWALSTDAFNGFKVRSAGKKALSMRECFQKRRK